MDQNRAADEAFQASYRGAHSLAPAAPTRSSVLPRPSAPRFSHINPTPGNPVPMDIDAAQKAKALLDVCRRCGKVGYWAKDCSLRFDIRYMNTDELERMLEDKLAAMDAVPAEQPEGPEPVDNVEDFVSRSG